MTAKKKKPIATFTKNDIWRFIGIGLIVLGYFADKEIALAWGDKTFTGGIFGVTGLVLLLAPIFLRRSNDSAGGGQS